ncbi:MAG: type II toxin-antitoxin system VapC family toxin [Candidatus Sigynarchaeota archaeon]
MLTRSIQNRSGKTWWNDTTDFFIDTNILWWYMVENSKHHKKVKAFLDPIIINDENSLIVNEFVMIELFHLLVKQKGKQGCTIAEYLLNEDHPFFQVKFDILQESDLNEILTILTKYRTTTTIGGRDSSILHSMTRHKITSIITNDKGFENVAGINVLDPIARGM